MATFIPMKEIKPKATERAYYAKNVDGDIRGSGFQIPKGDFGTFLGFKKPNERELQGDVSGSRAIEVAVHKQMNDLGKASMKNGQAYTNLWIASGRYEKQPGREGDAIKAGMDSMNESVELGHAMGMRYLEMQYKFQWASMSFGTVSNLMKARNDSVKKAINEVR